MKALERMAVPYTAVLEPQEVEPYVAAGQALHTITVLPHTDQGLVATRNWIWDQAQAAGVKRYWTIDDNITTFYRLTQNTIIQLASGTFLKVIEDFVDRYDNLLIAGMNYEMFAPRRQQVPPFVKNTRVYSNMLIQTNAPFRNEGFYNDDTDLCLRVLKAGFCTVLFNAFLAKKLPTMSVQGGMTPHYLDDGRYKMAKELQEKHPDVTKITRKWGRWQHQVDYSSFRETPLVFRKDVTIHPGINDYGMVLQEERLLGTDEPRPGQWTEHESASLET